MTIYHYTSIESLALILKHKTFRFNRLDRVDDLEESIYSSGDIGIKLGQYCFVSCWTKDPSENIALWKMYTDFKGVRIAIDEDLFVSYPVNNTFNSYFSDFVHFEEDCMFPVSNNEVRLYDVIYVPDNDKKIKSLITHSGDRMTVDTSSVGLYKKDNWKFQNECRFKLWAMPIDNSKIKQPKDNRAFSILWNVIEAMVPSLGSNYNINTLYKDMPIREDILKNMHVMLGPDCTEAERIIVESLLSALCNNPVEDSFFKGKIRRK